MIQGTFRVACTLLSFFYSPSINAAVGRLKRQRAGYNRRAAEKFEVLLTEEMKSLGFIFELLSAVFTLEVENANGYSSESVERYNDCAVKALRKFRSVPEKEWFVTFASDGLTTPGWMVCKKCGMLVRTDGGNSGYCSGRCEKNMRNRQEWLRRKRPGGDHRDVG